MVSPPGPHPCSLSLFFLQHVPLQYFVFYYKMVVHYPVAFLVLFLLFLLSSLNPKTTSLKIASCFLKIFSRLTSKSDSVKHLTHVFDICKLLSFLSSFQWEVWFTVKCHAEWAYFAWLCIGYLCCWQTQLHQCTSPSQPLALTVI